MNKTGSAIYLGLWGVWFIDQIFKSAKAIYSLNAMSAVALGANLGGLLYVGSAAFLAWRLLQAYHRITAVTFVLLCFVLLWKFWLGPIFMYLLPGLGGHSLHDAVGLWWSDATASFYRMLCYFMPPLFLCFSLFYWPCYCRDLAGKSE